MDRNEDTIIHSIHIPSTDETIILSVIKNPYKDNKFPIIVVPEKRSSE